MDSSEKKLDINDRLSSTNKYNNIVMKSHPNNVGTANPLPHSNNQNVMPYEIGRVKNSPIASRVNIVSSSDVHVGNKTIFNGSVTIQQVIGTVESRGCLKRDYEQTEKPVINKSKSQVFEETTGNVKCKFRKQHILLAIFCVSTTAALIAILSLIISNKYSERGDLTVPPFNDIDVEAAPNSTLRYVSRGQWIAQPPSDRLDDLALPAEMVIIAHTATQNCTIQSDCVSIVRNIQTYHIESRHWYDIGYNFLVGGDGSAYVGRGWNYVGAHTQHYNVKSIGIAFIGTFNTWKPPENQIVACQKLIQEGVVLGKIAKDYKLYGHRQLYSTLSPGEALYSIIKTWPHWNANVTERV